MPQELGGAPQNLTAACLAAPAHLWQSHACRSGLEQRILEKRAGLRMFKTGSLTSHASAALGQEGGLKRKDYEAPTKPGYAGRGSGKGSSRGGSSNAAAGGKARAAAATLAEVSERKVAPQLH
eukprot:1159074-Pelagomonas_calceolata.AAC.9